MSVTAKSKKVTSSHKTMTETSAEVVSELDRMECVSKISLGIIKHAPGGRRKIKFQTIVGGIKAIVRGNGAVHHLYVYTSEPDTVKQRLGEVFTK